MKGQRFTKILKSCVFSAVLAMTSAMLAGCGDEATLSSGLTITGTVSDISDSPASPASGVIVTLRKADHSTITTATTASDGSFVLRNVPASTDMYINVGEANYAGFNSEIINITADVSGKVLWIALASNVKYTVDLITGNTGTTSTWGSSFYTSQSWFTMDIYDTSGNEVPGIYVTSASSDPTILYNNGLDVFLPGGPTVTLSTHASASLVGGYNSSTGIYTFTPTDPSKTKTVKLPLVQGEMTYLSVHPW